MSQFVQITVLTRPQIHGNNRGFGSGDNVVPLQKVNIDGVTYTILTGESIKYAQRKELAKILGQEKLNRIIIEHEDDLCKLNNLGIPNKEAEGAKKAAQKHGQYPIIFYQSGLKKEDNSDLAKLYPDHEFYGGMWTVKKTNNSPGESKNRRAAVSVSPAISLTSYEDQPAIEHAASIGSTPGATKEGEMHPTPYEAEVHYTRYQYTVVISVNDIVNHQDKISSLIEAIYRTSFIGGSHSTNLADYSPDSVVIRVTHSPDNRIMDCFSVEEDLNKVNLEPLQGRTLSGDIPPKELYIGGSVVQSGEWSRGMTKQAEWLEEKEIEQNEFALVDNGVKRVFEEVKKLFE